MLHLDEKDGGVIFRVRVLPNARREGIEGEWEGALRVRVSAPPMDDRANDAVVQLLAARLKRPRTAAVSYTHLDVYKRQGLRRGPDFEDRTMASRSVSKL